MSARPQFIAGNTLCTECNKTVSSHPTDETRPYLYVMCSGVLAETKRNQKPAAKSNDTPTRQRVESLFTFRKLKPTSQRQRY